MAPIHLEVPDVREAGRAEGRRVPKRLERGHPSAQEGQHDHRDRRAVLEAVEDVARLARGRVQAHALHQPDPKREEGEQEGGCLEARVGVRALAALGADERLGGRVEVDRERLSARVHAAGQQHVREDLRHRREDIGDKRRDKGRGEERRQQQTGERAHEREALRSVLPLGHQVHRPEHEEEAADDGDGGQR
eukprot:5739139-Prymnesium_polylepis.1